MVLTYQKTSQEMIDEIRHPVMGDLEATNAFIIEKLASNVDLIRDVMTHILKGGGKRLRPLLVLLSARGCGYAKEEVEHCELAAIIEFVHTATLLHDDVVDESILRRGQKTANAIWGNQSSVLVGDFLYSRAFQMLTSRHNAAVMQCLADTTNVIAEGEVEQLMHRRDVELSEAHYYRIIYAKTAKLFESAAEIGAIVAGKDKSIQAVMACYGSNLGMTFQVVDDLLDYLSVTERLGKRVGEDLVEGRMTLPLIVAMRQGSRQESALIHEAVRLGYLKEVSSVRRVLEATGAIEYSFERARHYSHQALEALKELPSSVYKQSLEKLVYFSLHRDF